MNRRINKQAALVRRLIVLLIAFGTCLGYTSSLLAQTSACAVGSFVDYLSFVNFTGSTAGDMNISSNGSLHIGANGVFDVYGALENSGEISIDNGGVLNVYGDVSNLGDIIVSNGGRINFYGQDWTNSNVASVTGTGNIWFTSVRPTIDASWLATAPCASSYSGGSFSQNLDGGGDAVDMAINLFVNNANNVVLTGTTSIAGSLNFNMNNGDVLIGDNDLILTSTGLVNSFNPTRIVVTNGTGHMVKEGIAASASFFFPIGRAESDYTPATITNMAGSADNFYAQVKNYTESSSDEFDPTSGMDRTWNIYSSAGSAANLNLQHNSSTNDPGEYTTQGGDGAAFVTQYQGLVWVTQSQQNQGDWQLGAGGLNTYVAGTVVGSASHNRDYTATATSATANAAFFSKSSNAFAPLPVKIFNFNVDYAGHLKALVTWSTNEESEVEGYNVQRYEEETKSWVNIGHVKASGDMNGFNDYEFIDQNAAMGLNLYRVETKGFEGSSEYTDVKSIVFNEAGVVSVLMYPNPVGDLNTLHLVSNATLGKVVITDALGKVVMTIDSEESSLDIDLTLLSKGVYQVTVGEKVYKLVK